MRVEPKSADAMSVLDLDRRVFALDLARMADALNSFLIVGTQVTETGEPERRVEWPWAGSSGD